MKALETITKLVGVENIWPVQHHALPDYHTKWVGTNPSSLHSAGSRRNIVENYPPHVMTQIDRLNADGITGSGIRIAVIDTGIDYSHPLLGGCFGKGKWILTCSEGCVVGYGFDFVGDEYNGKNTPMPDPDPMDCSGHGTHIAGVIAAKENEFGFVGAASNVTIGAYRVYGCTGRGVTTDVLIAAFTKAVEDGSNIITASIGDTGGWPYDAWTLAVERIVAAGIPCILSTGNSGQDGLFMPGGAAHGKNVASVGSYDNNQIPTFWSTAKYTMNNSSEIPFYWTAGDPARWGNLSLPLVALSYDYSNSNDACNSLPANTTDLSDYIVLIRRGNCDFSQKAANAVARGARYIIFYSNTESVYSPEMTTDGLLGTGMISADQGRNFIENLRNGSKIVIKIIDPANAAHHVTFRTNNSTGGYISTYTSWGPTFELDVKPQFGAPGGWILSTYPIAKGGFAVLSGTSMACPLVAAIYALVAQVRQTFDPTTLRNILSATAKPTNFNNGTATYPYLAPVPQQGSGMLQAYDAAHCATLLSTSSLLLNDTAYFNNATRFLIHNSGHVDVLYHLSSKNAATAYTLPSNSIYPAKFPPELLEEHAGVQFSENAIIVPAGKSQLVEVTISPPHLDATRLGVYSGFITIHGTNGDILSLPFMGISGSMQDATVLAEGFLSDSTDAKDTPVSNGTRYELMKGLSSGLMRNNSNLKIPAVSVTLALGSPLLRVDVIPHSTSNSNTKLILGVASLGNIDGFPKRYLARGQYSWPWTGQLDDESYVPEGQYKLLIRALRIFGDPDNKEDYDEVETVAFSLTYHT
ncbi:hypothetical protein COCC4DRAFT_182381 [Bipolaris maydis ATCC 48331]|uniref:Peptidase S8/S53 domain-containing protein n=2 Tax=Cochliobolus heterostrophus TaxID=5016 RepID=M2SKQ1_COCH5|nr:uncharacterized protein COCC4DRAFT_182381 [Bipolaris maydis ATCC 48331]EMD85870.1 hypothetical protein COCHEDRAFT_1186816 [Bipolaris maydis C5]KAJ5025155.1 peptidase S8/S53 domain-containing protein [Bipolaris maydis]ENH98742.1 hypothetical protein COCC4DRAFT_182381 [Bipolaris maydis ATCC 48331]KAJ6194082.1 subtilisin-like serine protease PR1C [Bipolaris maydis]KAJ6212886.1 subtilisin-like serine protease PR1C [Bipolaris maydis]